MKPISLSVPVDAPRERVFDFISDLNRRPSWTDHFLHDPHLERIEAAGQGAAARYRVGAPGIGRMDTVIAEAERPLKLVEQGHGGRLNRTALKTVWELTDGPGAVTTVNLTFWMEPPRRRGGRWWRRRWKKALRRLSAEIESGAEAGPTIGVAGGNRQLTGIA